MSNYLLLRNNIESGPYSLNDLTELGLKAYDLVWVQGRSAAWRYPSEVEELKPYAPIVEEQPFDRFFKKPGNDKKEETPKQEIPVVQEKAMVQERPIVREIPVVAPEHERYIPKKSVFVTMPGQKSTTLPQQAQPERKEEQVYAIRKEETISPYAAPAQAQPTITVSENPAASQIKYSQPLDEIKEMYVKTLQDRKQKIARKGFWLQALKKGAALLSLVAVGVIAGFVIKSNGNKQQETVAQKPSQQQIVTTPANNAPDTNISAPGISAADAGIQTPIAPPNGGYVNKQTDRHEELKQSIDRRISSNVNDKRITGNVKKETLPAVSEKEINSSLVGRGVDIDPATGERNHKIRNGNSNAGPAGNNAVANGNEQRLSSGNDLSEKVSVKSNEYKKVAFGGIRDLELTVFNDSKYILDNVIVELQYLKPSEQPLRTENIQFKSIAPKATSTIRIPDTNRGIKVAYRIITIKSRQMDEGVAGN
jgi:hypothetical protein